MEDNQIKYINVQKHDLSQPPTAIYIGTRYFTAMDYDGCPMPGREIGWSKFGKKLEGVPYPPEMWFAREMLNALMDWQQLMREPEHRQYLGWSYNAPESPDGYRVMDLEVVRFDGVEPGQFWLWRLTGKKDELNNREQGVWKD